MYVASRFGNLAPAANHINSTTSKGQQADRPTVRRLQTPSTLTFSAHSSPAPAQAKLQ